MTLHIQLNDRSGIAVDTGFVKIIVSLKFPPKILLSQCLTGLQSGMPLEVAAIRFLLLQTWHIWQLFRDNATGDNERINLVARGYSLTRPLSFASGTSGRTLGTSLRADIPSNSLLDHFKGQGTDGKMLLLEVSLYLYVVTVHQ